MDSPMGQFMWIDIAVDDAVKIRDFYAKVAGWTWEALSVGDYEDYVMKNEAGDVVCGICHRRGTNSEIPSYWINYLTVASVEQSLAQVMASGGTCVIEPRKMGKEHYALVKDPAGAYFALYGPL